MDENAQAVLLLTAGLLLGVAIIGLVEARNRDRQAQAWAQCSQDLYRLRPVRAEAYVTRWAITMAENDMGVVHG